MLHSRNDGPIQQVLRAQQRLMEADVSRRGAERQSRITKTPEDHTRAAHQEIRAGADPTEVALQLHAKIPGAHEHLAQMMGSKHPQAATVATTPHLRDHNEAQQEQARQRNELRERATTLTDDPRWHEANLKYQKETRPRLEREARTAFDAFRSAAERHGKNPEHLYTPRSGEKMHEHLERLRTQFYGGRGAITSVEGRHHVGFDTKHQAERFATTARHHWGNGHEVRVVEPIGGPAQNRRRKEGGFDVRTTKRSEDG